MFERGDEMMTVAAQCAMIAVMHDDDVAVRVIRARDMRESLDQALRRLRFPVPALFDHITTPCIPARRISSQSSGFL